jgi:hypothetical protein
MDTAGIDFQILSLFDPSVQEETDVARAIDFARRANDELAETVRGNPHRFGGFATLATQDPDAAATELERAVTELGLVGGLINGHTQGRYLDDPAYEGLFGRAALERSSGNRPPQRHRIREVVEKSPRRPQTRRSPELQPRSTSSEIATPCRLPAAAGPKRRPAP